MDIIYGGFDLSQISDLKKVSNPLMSYRIETTA